MLHNLLQERDSAVAKESELRRELELLKERLESSQRAWQSTRRELEERESRFLSIESKAKETELFVRNSELQLRSFKEQLAGLLSDQTYVVEPYEDQIRERVRTLMTDYRDRLAVSEDSFFVFFVGATWMAHSLQISLFQLKHSSFFAARGTLGKQSGRSNRAVRSEF